MLHTSIDQGVFETQMLKENRIQVVPPKLGHYIISNAQCSIESHHHILVFIYLF